MFKIFVKNPLVIALSWSLLSISISSYNTSVKGKKETDVTVCITRTGTKYHRCYHYQGRNTPISLKEAKKMGYSACKVCKPPE